MLLKEPKSRKGKRPIPLLVDTGEALKHQRLRCKELEAAAADSTPNDLVFPNATRPPRPSARQFRAR
jgi:hypothetical protein